MNLLAAGLANIYEARSGGSERCELTESTIPVVGRNKRYGPSTLIVASFEDLKTGHQLNHHEFPRQSHNHTFSSVPQRRNRRSLNDEQQFLSWLPPPSAASGSQFPHPILSFLKMSGFYSQSQDTGFGRRERDIR